MTWLTSGHNATRHRDFLSFKSGDVSGKRVIVCTVAKACSSLLLGAFDQIGAPIVDEASQIPAATLLGLIQALPGLDRVLVVGDLNQLGPVVMNQHVASSACGIVAPKGTLIATSTPSVVTHLSLPYYSHQIRQRLGLQRTSQQRLGRRRRWCVKLRF